MRVIMAADPGGQAYLETLRTCVVSHGAEVRDISAARDDDGDWPDVVQQAGRIVAGGEADRGILIGPTGNGEAMIVNRIPQARCTVCWDVRSALVARRQLDANLLAIARELVPLTRAQRIVETWLRQLLKRGAHHGLQRMGHPHSDRIALGNPNGRGHHLSPFFDEPIVVCDRCGEEFAFSLDLLDGATQDLIEECPVCGQENRVLIEVDADGGIRALGDPDVSH